MKMTLIRWHDACSVEALGASTPARAGLSDLTEVGFILDETEDAVLIGMELSNDDTDAGRWRLNIPKGQIKERLDFAVGAKLTVRRVKPKPHGRYRNRNEGMPEVRGSEASS
jgi:hypothetical protein